MRTRLMNVQASIYPRINPLAAQRHRSADVPVRYAASAFALAIDSVPIVATSVVTGIVFMSASHNQTGDIGAFAACGVMAVFFCALGAILGQANAY